MNARAHSPEPWRTINDQHTPLVDADGVPVMKSNIDGSVTFSNYADPERIALCLNACKGIASEALKTDSYRAALEREVQNLNASLLLARQKKELAEALKKFASHRTHCPAIFHSGDCTCGFAAAIEKAGVAL